MRLKEHQDACEGEVSCSRASSFGLTKILSCGCIIAWFPALRGDQEPGYGAPSLPIVRCYAATDYGQQAPKSEIKGG